MTQPARSLVVCLAACLATWLADAAHFADSRLFAEGPSPDQDGRPIAELDRDTPIDYARDIVPFLKRSCLACHFEQDPEGDLNLETHSGLLAGGFGGPGIVPGEPDESSVWLRASGHEDPVMPPEDNVLDAEPLSPRELALLKRWIEQGAEGGDTTSGGIDWTPLPESVRPVYSVAISPDSKWVARARGNRVSLFDLRSGERVVNLVDPELASNRGEDLTDVDLIQAVAFSPLGDRIATGGFRSVKLWRRVHQRLGPADSPLARSVGPVASDPTGKTWAWIDAIGNVESWDADNDQPPRIVARPKSRPVGLALSTGGKRLVLADADGNVVVWDLKTDSAAARLAAETSLVGLAASNDATKIAAIRTDGSVALWSWSRPNAPIEPQRSNESDESDADESDANESETGDAAPTELTRLSVGTIDAIDSATAIRFLPGDPTTLAVAHDGGRIDRFSLPGGEPASALDHGAKVLAIAVDADGKRIATAGEDGVTRIWNLADGAPLETLQGDPADGLMTTSLERDLARQSARVERLNERTGEINAAIEVEEKSVAEAEAAREKAAEDVAEKEQQREAAANKVAATESEIEKARREAEQARERIEKRKQEIAEAEKAIEASEAAIANAQQAESKLKGQLEADRKSLDEKAKEKEASEKQLGEREQTLETATDRLRRVASRLPEHEATIRAASRRTERSESRLDRHRSRRGTPAGLVVGLAFSPDGRRITSRHRDGTARIYRAGETTAAQVLRPPHEATAEPLGVAFGPGDTVCLFDRNSPASVWEVDPRWQLERTIGSPQDSPISDRTTAIDFRPDGLAIAVGSGPPSRSGQVLIFATDDGRLLRDFGAIHGDTVFGLRFSPDGTALASSAADKTVRLTDVASGEAKRTLEGHTHHVLSLAWNDDLESIASAAADQTVKVWDVETGGQRRTIGGFPKEVTAIRFVGASDRIVSACGDGQVRLHDADNGKLIRTLQVSPDFLFAVDVTPDGKTLVTGGQTGELHVWDLEEGKRIHETN